MNRATLLKAAALVTILGGACPMCDSSCMSSEDHSPMLEHDRILDDLFARSDAAVATPAMRREWEALRTRYQEALRAHGPSPLLADARLVGSATLAASPEARERFREAMARADALARLGRNPNAAEMASLQRHLVSDPAHARLRAAGERATPGASGNRAYLTGALVEEHVDRLFATLADELASRDASLTPAIAARLDQKLVSIHPYVDGNGRVARLMSDWLLVRDGFPPAVPTTSAALHATHGPLDNVGASAHLERITDGMRNAVLLAELG